VSDTSTVKSPCVNVCALDEHDICIGCYRSAAEIARWSGLSAAQQRDVIRLADQRYRRILESAERGVQ
jgi:uncharacterized protein